MQPRSLELSRKRADNSLLDPESGLNSLTKLVGGWTRQYSEPPERCCHTMQAIAGKVFAYGGMFSSKLPLSLVALASKVYVYDPNTELWTMRETGGEWISPGISDTASVSINDALYVYGGCDLHGNVTNGLYRFDTESLSWYNLTPHHSDTSPIKVRGCGMVAFGSSSLGVFGGTWMPLSRDGCTNTFHVYDLQTAKWELIPTNGQVPKQCCHFSLTMVAPWTAVLFGGYIPHQGLSNATYIFNLHLMDWKRVEGHKGEYWPLQRSNHAVCCLNFGDPQPYVFVTGGVVPEGVVNDAWLFNVATRKWQNVNIHLRPRNAHAMAAVMLCPGVAEVVAFGGCSKLWKGPQDTQAKLSRSASYMFQYDVQKGWIVLSQADSKTLGKPKRLATKEQFHHIKLQYEYEEQERRRNEMERQKLKRKQIQESNDVRQLEQAQIVEIRESEREIKAMRLLQEHGENFKKRHIAMAEEMASAQRRLAEMEKQVKSEIEKLNQEATRVNDVEARVQREKRHIDTLREREVSLAKEREDVMSEMKGFGQSGNQLQAQIDSMKVKQKEQKREQQCIVDGVIASTHHEASKEIQKAEKAAVNAAMQMKQAEQSLEAADQRERELEEKIISLEKQALSSRRQVNNRYTVANDNLQAVIQEKVEMEWMLEQALSREKETDILLQEAHDNVYEMEQRKERAQDIFHRAEQQEQTKNEEARQAEERISELQQLVDNYERRRQESIHAQRVSDEDIMSSWVLGEGELQVTDECIGRGGWAQVNIGRLRVAAKFMHHELDSEYYHRIFRREMNIAARVSHPNLLRFLGGRLHGGMVILTELMPTSLRSEIEGKRSRREHLSEEHIVSISLDICYALNYLHSIAPHPIIHRDISSANVLLKPSINGGWLAKVSDYGSANIQTQIMSRCPGSPVYLAPEAHAVDGQTVKMDIYSFGVVVVEMCTCKFPVPEIRNRLIDEIQQPHMVELIVQCLNQDRERRPRAEQIITILTEIRNYL